MSAIVARLLREGRTDPQTGEELGLSIEQWKASRIAERGLDGPASGAADRAASGGESHPSRVDQDGDLAAGITVPERVGAYRISGVLGVGGMGIVYRAEQEDPRRAVALKMIRPGLISGVALRRFEHEGLLLARLDHPGIAKVYETGVVESEGGPRPFIAMELVEGRSLRESCMQGQLAPRACLELMLQVCDAIEHAHERGVVHRDLKPTNILIDAEGRPKVVDFGAARTSGVVEGLSTLTYTGQLIGTLAYMSPEQTTGAGADVDLRTDVYSLGVILHELLAQRLPYDVDGKSVYEVMRSIQHDEPLRLSVSVPVLKGDLESIVLKALEKDPLRRYPSAAALRDDIARHLSGAAVLARPPSAVHQLRKLAARHRGLVIGLSAALLVLIVATVISITLALEASSQRDRARAETDRLRVMEEIQGGMLFATDPRAYMPYVKNAAAHVATDYAGRPAAEAAARRLFAAYTWRAGEFDAWREQLDRIVALAEPLGPKHPLVLDASLDIVDGLTTLQRYTEAEAALAPVWKLCMDSAGATGTQRLRCLAARITCLRELRRGKEVADLADDAVARVRSSLETDDPVRWLVLRAAAQLAVLRGQEEEGIAMLRECVEAARARFGAGHSRFHENQQLLASALCAVGGFDEAIEIGSLGLQASREQKGEDHPDTRRAAREFGRVLLRAGRPAEAVALLEPRDDGAPLVAAGLGAEALLHRLCLADALLAVGDAARAGTIAAAVEDRCAGRGDVDPIIRADATHLLGLASLGLGRAEEAVSHLERALEGARAWDADHPATIRLRCDHARCLRELGRFEQAEIRLLDCQALLAARLGSDSRRTRDVARELALLYSSWNRPDEAQLWRARAE